MKKPSQKDYDNTPTIVLDYIEHMEEALSNQEESYRILLNGRDDFIRLLMSEVQAYRKTVAWYFDQNKKEEK